MWMTGTLEGDLRNNFISSHIRSSHLCLKANLKKTGLNACSLRIKKQVMFCLDKCTFREDSRKFTILTNTLVLTLSLGYAKSFIKASA